MHHIYYHSADLDGKCSGEIARAALSFDGDSTLHPINYGEPYPAPTDFKPGLDAVYLLDFSLPLDLMMALQERLGSNFVWIDHHTGILAEAEAAGFNPVGIRTHDQPAACLLTWQHFYPDKPVPYTVQLLSDYDTWQLCRPVLAFQYGMRTQPCDPGARVWARLLWDYTTIASQAVTRIMDTGNIIYDYTLEQNRHACKSAHWSIINGMRTLCLNRLFANSIVFDPHPERAEAQLLMAYGWDKTHWRVTIWSGPAAPDIDCAAIAKQYGGGGHKNVAGFQLSSLTLVHTPVPVVDDTDM